MKICQSNRFMFDFGEISCSGFIPSAVVSASKTAGNTVLTPDENVKSHGSKYVTTFLGNAKEETFSWETEEYRLTWKVSYADKSGTAGVFVQSAVTNLTDHDIYLSNFSYDMPKDGAIVCQGDPSEWYLANKASLGEHVRTKYELDVERCTAWGMPIPKKPENPNDTYADGRFRSFGEFLTLFSRTRKKGLFISPVGLPIAFVSSHCLVLDEDPHRGEISKLEITADMSNVLVHPGETRWGQEIGFVYGTYKDAVEGVMRHLAETHGSRANRPAVTGWCSWYDLASKITEESVMTSAKCWEKMKNRRPVDVIQIDDGYQIQNGNWGCNQKFPNGWKEFIETVNKAGAIPGIWLAPITVHDSTPAFAEHPEWFPRNADGSPIFGTCGNWGPTSYWMDLTHPEAMAFAANTLREKREMGFLYFKIDFNNVSVNGKVSHDASRTRLQVYRDLYASYREAIGEDAYLCGCADFGRGTFGYVDSNRIGPDSIYVWVQLDPCNLRNCTDAIAETCFTNGIIYANDPDVTYLYPKPCGEHPVLTWDELRTWHTAVGLLGGTQMISDPVAEELPQQNFEMMEMLVPPAKETANTIYPAADPKLSYFGMPVNRPFGNFNVMMVHNPADEAANMPIPEVSAEPCHVWSFWDKQYLGVKDGDFSVDVARHGCSLLRFTPVRPDGKLTLIGSDLHVSLGAAEISDMVENGNVAEIFLDAYAGKRDGALYFAVDTCPDSVTVTGVDAFNHTWKDGILCVQFKGRALEGEQKIQIRM